MISLNLFDRHQVLHGMGYYKIFTATYFVVLLTQASTNKNFTVSHIITYCPGIAY